MLSAPASSSGPCATSGVAGPSAVGTIAVSAPVFVFVFAFVFAFDSGTSTLAAVVAGSSSDHTESSQYPVKH